MREIIFRGKRIDNGEWISSGTLLTLGRYGEKEYFIPELHGKVISTIDDADNIIMLEEGMFARVDPSTVGQYTGLTDKNGEKIFEGDVCRVTIFDPFDEDEQQICRVEYCEGCFYYRGKEVYCQLYNLFDTIECTEVVGNIYDNPELLEGAK